MRYRVAKKIIMRTNAGATYRKTTYARAYRMVVRRMRQYYPAHYENWYYSKKMALDLNSMMEANGFEARFNMNVVVVREAA